MNNNHNQINSLSFADGPHVYVYSEISRKEGESVTIDASINASPEPARIVWRREGQSTILSTGYKMVLSNITKEDAGKYIVEATSIRMRENNLTEEFTGNATVVLKVQCKFCRKFQATLFSTHTCNQYFVYW